MSSWEIYGIYSDDDYTETDRNRPGFNEVIRLAQEKKFDIILCKSQSRFARELEIVEKYINGLFLDWGIRFVSMTENIDTAIERRNYNICSLPKIWRSFKRNSR